MSHFAFDNSFSPPCTVVKILTRMWNCKRFNRSGQSILLFTILNRVTKELHIRRVDNFLSWDVEAESPMVKSLCVLFCAFLTYNSVSLFTTRTTKQTFESFQEHRKMCILRFFNLPELVHSNNFPWRNNWSTLCCCCILVRIWKVLKFRLPSWNLSRIYIVSKVFHHPINRLFYLLLL